MNHERNLTYIKKELVSELLEAQEEMVNDMERFDYYEGKIDVLELLLKQLHVLETAGRSISYDEWFVGVQISL